VALPAKAFAADRAASAVPGRGRVKGSGLLLEELAVRQEAVSFRVVRADPLAASAAPGRGRAKGSGLLLEELAVHLEAVSFQVVQADPLADRVLPEVGSRPSGSSSGR
jgi:hypothetical protein